MRQMVECFNRGGEMPRYAPGDYVKVEFKNEHTGENEWMWVKVESADDAKQIVFGWLDSRPAVFTDKLRLGQRLAVSYENIREHRKDTDFTQH